MSTGTRRNLFWPNVDDVQGATWASRQGFWAALFCATITTGAVVLAELGVEFLRRMGMDAWALIDAVIFAAIAFGLWRHSRFAAWAGLLVYAFERIFMWSVQGPINPVVAAIFVLAFVGGVRGTHALYRLRNAVHVVETRERREAA